MVGALHPEPCRRFFTDEQRLGPNVVRRLLARSANVLLWLFDHPRWTWLLLWITKIAKFVVCLLVFGLPEADREVIIEKVTAAINPLTHLPFVEPMMQSLARGPVAQTGHRRCVPAAMLPEGRVLARVLPRIHQDRRWRDFGRPQPWFFLNPGVNRARLSTRRSPFSATRCPRSLACSALTMRTGR